MHIWNCSEPVFKIQSKKYINQSIKTVLIFRFFADHAWLHFHKRALLTFSIIWSFILLQCKIFKHFLKNCFNSNKYLKLMYVTRHKMQTLIFKFLIYLTEILSTFIDADIFLEIPSKWKYFLFEKRIKSETTYFF